MTPARRAASALALALALAGAVTGAAARPAIAGPGVLVWPRTPDAAAEAAARTASEDLRAAGATPIPFATVATRLEAAAAREARADAAALAAVQSALEAARAAFLDQRFDAMQDALARAERAGSRALARPEHVDLAWELTVQRGIAYLLRGGDGDADRAAERFALALALRPDARPDRAVYGPDVAHAFARQVAARAALSPQPVPIAVEPAHAAVHVDGTPLVEPTGWRSMRPGLHLIAASAPGYAPASAIARADVDRPLRLTLAPLAAPSPAATVAPGWLEGRLEPAAPDVSDALLALARSVGARAVVLVDGSSAILIAAGGERVVAAPGAPLRALLARLGDDGALGPMPPIAPAPARAPERRWWLWAGAGAGAVIAGVLTAVVWSSAGDSRLRVLAPEP